METVEEVARRLSSHYEARLHNHPNIEALQLLEAPQTRRLQRRLPLFILTLIRELTFILMSYC